MQYIVGDIHGEITKLTSLIKVISSIDQSPEFIFLGDYIDKGENPFQTLVFLENYAKEASCFFICGNHEYLWLKMKENDTDTQKYLLKYGAQTTISSFNTFGIWETRQRLVGRFSTFFQNLKNYWTNDAYVAVHSGIRPEDYDVPIHNIDLPNLLFNRYDFLKQGRCYFDNYKIVFGHTGFYFPYVDNYKIGVDTAACFLPDQPLTAFCVDLNEFIASNNQRRKVSDFNPNMCPNIPRTKPWRQKNGF